MGGETFHSYGNPAVRTSSKILDSELLSDDDVCLHGDGMVAQQLPTMGRRSYAEVAAAAGQLPVQTVNYVLMDKRHTDELSNPHPTSELPAEEIPSDDGFMDVGEYMGEDVCGDVPAWLMHSVSSPARTEGEHEKGEAPDAEMLKAEEWTEIFSSMADAVVDTSYPSPHSSSPETFHPPSTRPSPTTTTLSAAGMPIPSLSPTQVLHILTNLQIPLSELLLYATPDPSPAHTSLMPPADVELLLRSLGWVCGNLGLDEEQIWALSAGERDVSVLNDDVGRGGGRKQRDEDELGERMILIRGSGGDVGSGVKGLRAARKISCGTSDARTRLCARHFAQQPNFTPGIGRLSKRVWKDTSPKT